VKDALLARIRDTKKVFYNMVVAQAQKIEATGDRITFVFSPSQKALVVQFEQQRSAIEAIAQEIAGRRIVLAAEQSGGGGEAPAAPAAESPTSPDRKAALRQQALADSGVQAMLEVFPAEIRDVEEM
jgi:hypothetical protein